AASFYDELLKTFPETERKSELTFLMAEALNDAGSLPRAVAAYEQVAYEFLDEQRGATAGYAAILALDSQLQQYENLPAPETQGEQEALTALQNHRINSAISFADYYPADERAVAVLTNAAERLYREGDKEQAIVVASRLTTWQPTQSLALQKTAWLVLAHSQFELEQYQLAEEAYRHVLTIIAETDQDRAQVLDRIAASMYKRAEQEIAVGAKSQGVNRMLSISLIAPATELAMNGQYDAANYLVEMQEWTRAERVLIDFQQRFPAHQLAKTIPPKLAVIYQETEQWDKAAEQLAIMSSGDADPETRRSALYLSAELYQKSGNVPLAKRTYGDYIQRYPEPFDLALEARVQLLEMAKAQGAVGDQERWLKELITVDAKAGANRSARSTYLAAQSASYFAAKDLAAFESIRLRAPIKKTLTAKRKAMDETLKSYKTVIDYGVAEFATEANHRIGEVYANLYQALLDSERPAGLDELTMEQYEIMLEEQAYPFKGKAVEMLVINAERSWEGFYDKWVKQSFDALEILLPARYGKKETVVEVSKGVH
ncbi:MAG TPA: tetratricopeptide repeat protein, partial [Marinagarivorans sp.]